MKNAEKGNGKPYGIDVLCAYGADAATNVWHRSGALRKRQNGGAHKHWPCCVISADLPLAAQLKAGDKMRFAPIEINEAQAIYRRHMAELDEFIRITEHGFIYRHRPYYTPLFPRCPLC